MTGSVGISGSLSVNGISTLTGALSGTSATFSDKVGIGATPYASTTAIIRAVSATSTNYALIIEDNATNQLFEIKNNGAATFSSSVQATAFIPSGATVPSNGMYLSAANTLDFATNTTNRLSITSAGNVGIGITSPLAKLTIKGVDGTPGATDKGIFQIVDGSLVSLAIGGYTALPYGMFMQVIDAGSGNSGTYPLILNPNGGNVGIGTTSPVSKLTVFTPTTQSNAGVWSNCEIAMHNSTSVGDYSQIGLGYTTGTTNAAAFIGFISTSATANGKGSLVFGTRDVTTDTAPTTRLTIASTGAATFSSSVTATSFSNAGLQASEVFNATKSNAGYFVGYFQNTSATGLGLYIQNGNDSNDCLRIGNAAGSANTIKLFGSGKAYFAGNVGIGTESPFSLLQVTSGTTMSTSGGDQASNATIEGANVAIGASFTGQLAVLTNSAIAADSGGSIVFGSKYSGNAFAYYAAIKTGKDDSTSNNYGGYLQFATRVNGGNLTERMRITSGGNVGIGTTTPDLYSLNFPRQFTVSNATASGYSSIAIAGGAGGGGGVDFGNQTVRHAGIFSLDVSGIALYTNGTNSGTTITERMRITSGGETLFNTTSNSATSGTGFKILTNGEIPAVVTAASTDGGRTSYTLYSTGAGAFRFYVGAGGTIFATSTSISAISDISLKTNIRNLDKGLDEIMKLKPRRFDWKNGDNDDVMGFIAQEVEEIFPELIGEYMYNKTDSKKSLKMGDLLPSLVKAIQEQQVQIEAQQSQIEALKLLIK